MKMPLFVQNCRPATHQIAKRILALVLISTLLAPVILLNPAHKVSAQSVKISQPAPPSALPEPFVMNIAESSTPFMAASVFSLANVFSSPKPPEGLEIAKMPTFASGLTSYLGSFFGLFTGSSTKSAESEALFPAQPAASVDFDFDGDGKTDVGRWHSSTTEMKIKNSTGGSYSTFTVGSSGAQAAPGDFNGDGKTDAAVFLNGVWKYKTSTGGSEQTVTWGTTGDIPVAGDYDADGKTDFAVFRPSTNYWWVLYSSTSTYAGTAFGSSGDIKVPGDYDGDSYTDMAVYRPSTGDWHIQGSNLGYFSVHWGNSTDTPVPADYDGDGKTDPAVYRASSGYWYVYKSIEHDGTYLSQAWGNYGDQPVPGDYDGDSNADYAVWRPTTGVWYIINSDDLSYSYHALGVAGDTAVPSAYLKQVGAPVTGDDLNKERLSPKNATGGTDLYSQNFSWSTGLVGLPGRSGLNAGFGMSYNSLVWIKQDSAMIFDPDNSNMSPGFRFGFPVIEPVYYEHSEKDIWAYMMVTPSGGRVQFRQIGASNVYQTADSSYTQLVTTGASTPNDPVDDITIKVTTTDGTQMRYEWKAGAFRCTQIKDRNGNYITIANNDQGGLATVTDTLGRIVTVNYDSQGYPTSITQTWKGSNGASGDTTHTWASFTYTTKEITTDFDGISTIYGPPNGTTIKVLEKVIYTDTSHTDFSYNSYGQVWRIQNYADNDHELNNVRINLETPAADQADCPRFTQTKSYVENFNSGGDVTINNSLTPGQTYSLPDIESDTATRIQVWMDGHPDNLRSISWVGEEGWKEGLPLATEDCLTTDPDECTTRKRWTWTDWTQDDTESAVPLNPRVTETRVGDTSNVKMTTIDYYAGPGTYPFRLPETVKVYGPDLSTVIKQSHTVYNVDSEYTDRRIIGLPEETQISGTDSDGTTLNLVSKVTYAYDEGSFSDSGLAQNISPLQHDNTNYGSGFTTGRGNLTSTMRWDVAHPTDDGYGVTSSVKYNTAGSVVSQTDPLSRVVKISYADNFNSTPPGDTYAYPTTLTDPANHSSTVKYRYDMGANVEAVSPAPAGNTYGKKSRRFYDSVGRIEKESVGVEAASGGYTEHTYTRYGRPSPDTGIQVFQYTPIIDADGDGNLGEDEVTAETLLDGAGRTRMSRTENPGSTGGFTGQKIEYNALGQVKRQSVPTEIDSSWNAAGDDYTRGFLWTYQKYDWKGRVVRKINTDGTDSPTANDSDVFISYEGCGCAGGQVTTIEGENIVENNWAGTSPSTLGRRKQKIYEDIQGREVKTEVYNWNGTSVYSTTVNTFNGRDQITSTMQYEGGTTSSTHREVTMDYDGFGRMTTRHYPIENSGTNTSWTYNDDDSIHTTADPRGVVTTFSYGSTTGLMTGIAYTVPSGLSDVNDTPDVAFTYDNLGNRTEMTDGTGSTTYAYNGLSQMTSETKSFTGLSGSFTMNYTYNLSGGLKTISDPQDSTRKAVYNHDKTGRIVGADMLEGSTSTQYVHDTKYRAWGGLKRLEYDYHSSSTIENAIELTYDNRLQVSNYETEWNSSTSLSADFTRYADGKVRTATANSLSHWDYLYTYDHVGRMVKGYSGKDAHGDSGMTDGPFKQDLTYNGFSDMMAVTGKNWGVTIHDLAKSYTSSTGRDANTGYDAAGNVITDQVQHAPLTVIDRDLKYDAAGRQVETFDPALHSCCEVDRTHKNYYDGNGWEAKTENISSSETLVTYEIRSTVLGGEKVGELIPYTSNSHKKFIAPVIGGELTFTDLGVSEETVYTREAPEGFGYDPMGAPVGEEPGTGFTGSNGQGYPGSPDPGNPNRCTWERMPISCAMADRLNSSAGYRASSLARGKGESRSRRIILSQAVRRAMNTAFRLNAKATSKPGDEPNLGGTISTPSRPCGVNDCVVTVNAPPPPPEIVGTTNLGSSGSDASESGGMVEDTVPILLPENLRDLIKERIGKKDGPCNSFIAKLIAKASEYAVKNGEIVKTGGTSYATDGLDALSKISKFVNQKIDTGRGFDASGTIDGSIPGKNATVVLGLKSRYAKSTFENYEWTMTEQAHEHWVTTAIHEMIHLSGKDFGDQFLARALYDLGETKTEIPSKLEENQSTYSDKLSAAVSKYCGPGAGK